jgi:hypothetical protein
MIRADMGGPETLSTTLIKRQTQFKRIYFEHLLPGAILQEFSTPDVCQKKVLSRAGLVNDREPCNMTLYPPVLTMHHEERKCPAAPPRHGPQRAGLAYEVLAMCSWAAADSRPNAGVGLPTSSGKKDESIVVHH